MMKTNGCPSRAPGGLVGGRQGRRWEQGQTLVFAALLMIVLVGALALVIDVGNAYAQRRLAQNAADAAALAGVRGLALDQTVAQIDAVVDEYAVRRNRGQSYEMAVLSRTVVVTITKTFPTIFAAAVGSPTMTVVAVAEGVYKLPKITDGLAPLGVQKDAVVEGEEVTIWDSDKESTDDPSIITGGERGWLNFDNEVPNAASLSDWIKYGYNGDVYSAEACEDMESTDPNCAWILGSSGTMAVGVEPLQSTYAPFSVTKKVLLVPVYDTVRTSEYVGGGSLLDFHIVGFAAFKVSWVGKDKLPGETAKVVKIVGEFDKYIDLGEIDEEEDGELDYGVRVIGLGR